MGRALVLGWLSLALLGACAGVASAPDASVEDIPRIIEDTPRCAVDGAVTDVPRADVATPSCCDEAMCAAELMRCDRATCRCEMVPCDTVGAPCPAGAIPGVGLPLVCAQDVGGRFCHVQAESVRACPTVMGWCANTSPCACGEGACRPLLDRCPDGSPCIPSGAWSRGNGGVAGLCRGVRPGAQGLGAYCEGSTDCVEGLLCVGQSGIRRCVRPECGFVAGVGACPAGRVCRLFIEVPLLGTCLTPCEPADPYAPCGATEACLRDGDDGPAFCVAVSADPLPQRGQDCLSYCRPGAVCVEQRCQAACRPGARVNEVGACGEGARCVLRAGGWICARDCDLFAAADGCVAGTFCAPEADVCGALRGSCRVRPAGLPGLGEPCWEDCAYGLGCPQGASSRCLPLCVPGVSAGPGACAAGTRCFKTRSGVQYGVCARPCVVGDGSCPTGTWCEPRWLDAETDRWTGFCS